MNRDPLARLAGSTFLKSKCIRTPQYGLETSLSRLAELTSRFCGPECGRPGKGCAPEACETAIAAAKAQFGITLERTRHKHLPLMGEYGCTAAPYLRPACAFYLCTEHGMSVALNQDPDMVTNYRILREDAEKMVRAYDAAPKRAPKTPVKKSVPDDLATEPDIVPSARRRKRKGNSRRSTPPAL